MLTAEVRPYAEAGGLSGVTAGLSKALAGLGVEVKVVSPLHASVKVRAGIEKRLDLPAVTMGSSQYEGALFADQDGQSIEYCFIDQPKLFERRGVYLDPETGDAYPDDFERFNYFMLSSLEAVRLMGWRPDVMHCHGSQTALIPAYLKLAKAGDPFYRAISSVLTIHDLGYQGQFDGDKFGLTNLPPELFYPMSPFEYYGKLNLLKAGICYADSITTVSRQYAREIQTPEYGCGLHEVLQRRKDCLHGILNGLDPNVWNPATDGLLEFPFCAGDLAGKQANKRSLQRCLGLPEKDVPLIGMISRLAEQDGMDLLLRSREALREIDCQWAILAAQPRQYAAELEDWARQDSDGFAMRSHYSDRLAHRIHAASDILLMPSRYEPCGLNQMSAMRYGAVPVVRHCGGLVDTVQQFDPKTGQGQGFKFYAYETGDLVKALRQAICLWRSDKETWRQLVANGMAQDFSWERSAERYIEVYRTAMHHG